MTHAIVADRLIDGSGRDPVADAVVVWDEGHIVAAGPRSAVDIPHDATVLEGDDLTLLPGFIDCHVHLGLQAGMHMTRMMMTPRSLSLLYAVPNCRATLEAGFTTVRDAGGTPVGVRLAVERGFFPGPRLHLAIQILSQTGGHADGYLPCGAELRIDSTLDVPSPVVDGVDGMRRKVREVLRAGADCIKLCTSGGVLSPGDLPDTPQFTVEEIAVAVYEAGVHRKHVLAHAMSAQGIKNALHAGVRSIEHGCLLDEEGVALLKAKDAYLVPTLKAPRDVVATAATNPGAIPDEMVRKGMRVSRYHDAALRAAVEAGVNVAFGTDAGVGAHGENAGEFQLLVDNGMTPMQAICSATSVASRLLEIDGVVGTVEQGKVADLVAVSGDPLADIGILADPERIKVVVHDGVLARDARAQAPAVV